MSAIFTRIRAQRLSQKAGKSRTLAGKEFWRARARLLHFQADEIERSERAERKRASLLAAIPVKSPEPEYDL